MTNPILTEDDFIISPTRRSQVIPNLDETQLFIVKSLTHNEAEQIKQQILTALEQYPKLKEKWDLYVKFSRQGYYSFDCEPEDGSVWGGCVKREKFTQIHQQLADKINENQRLRAENEELRQLDNEDWREERTKLQQENIELKQLKQRVEEWKKRLQSKAHLIEYTHEMLIDKIDNELLKDDVK